MSQKLIRVGTVYIPVNDIKESSNWYINHLGAELTYQDSDKAILNLANQSFFLVRSIGEQHSNFFDINGKECFSITFEVDGIETLKSLHKEFIELGI